MPKPISTIPDGDRDDPSPVALPATCRKLLKIEVANAGALISSHQKKPTKMVKRTNSAKNSPMSALRRAIIPNVHTIEITTNVQNNQVAASVTTPAHPLAAVL